MSEGRRTQIRLLDDRQLDIIVQPRLTVDELLCLVASYCRLKDSDKKFFGLAFLDERQQYHWLQNERRVLDHEFPRKFIIPGATLVLCHLIKLFVDSIMHLCNPSTVELFFLQASAQVYQGHVTADNDSIFRLAAYLVQIYCGDFANEQVALNHFKRLPLFPAKTLTEYSSIGACEQHVLDIYKSLVGTSRGAAVVKYMELVEKLHTYGVHFFEVKDKSGSSYHLGISRFGIFQYDINEHSKPMKGFYWKQLENLYYRDKKFSVEVHEAKRVSVSRRAFVPSNIRIYAYFCDTAQLCKSIWSLTIAQHQFYLDRRQAQKQGASLVNNAEELAAKLNACPSILSNFSNNFVSGGKSSTSDLGSSISSQSLQSISNTHERTEDERCQNREAVARLKSKKSRLDVLLEEKIAELKEICIKEGTITGQLPAEIKRALAPGEIEPKIQRRVGTSFSIPLELMSKRTKADKIVKLEADIEVQRRIVTAALKLANDVTTNKLVRKRRRRDYQCAQLKLRELDQQLHQLRLGSSKPDLVDGEITISRADGKKKKKNDSLRSTKSAPNTPRGSLSDLTEENGGGSIAAGDLMSEEKSSLITDKPPIVPYNNARRPSNLSTALRTNGPSSYVNIEIKTASGATVVEDGPTRTHFSTSLPTSPYSAYARRLNSFKNHSQDGGVLFNTKSDAVGYKSHASYQSSYRRLNYPTLNESQGQVVQTAAGGSGASSSNEQLNSDASSLQSLPGCLRREAFHFFERRFLGARGHAERTIGAYNIPNQRTSWDYDCLNHANTLAAFLSSSESLDATSHMAPAPGTQGNSSARCTISIVPNVHYTGSLDRTVLKERQKEKWKRMGLSTGEENKNTNNVLPPPRGIHVENNQLHSNRVGQIRIQQFDQSPVRYGTILVCSNSTKCTSNEKNDCSNTSTTNIPVCSKSRNTPKYTIVNGNQVQIQQHCQRKASLPEHCARDYPPSLPLRRKNSQDGGHSTCSSSSTTITNNGNSSGHGGLVVECVKPYETSDVLKYSERLRVAPLVAAPHPPQPPQEQFGVAVTRYSPFRRRTDFQPPPPPSYASVSIGRQGVFTTVTAAGSRSPVQNNRRPNVHTSTNEQPLLFPTNQHPPPSRLTTNHQQAQQQSINSPRHHRMMNRQKATADLVSWHDESDGGTVNGKPATVV